MVIFIPEGVGDIGRGDSGGEDVVDGLYMERLFDFGVRGDQGVEED